MYIAPLQKLALLGLTRVEKRRAVVSLLLDFPANRKSDRR
jgi:hypothetical protein